MRRPLHKNRSIVESPEKLFGGAAGAVLALALGIGAHGASLEAYFTSPVAPFSSSLLSYQLSRAERCAARDANLAEAEMNLSFDSGASTSSDHLSFDGRDLVRFLSYRPVITSILAGPACCLFRQ
jgi:hypothetical protein